MLAMLAVLARPAARRARIETDGTAESEALEAAERRLLPRRKADGSFGDTADTAMGVLALGAFQ